MKRRAFLNLSIGLAALLQSRLTAALTKSQRALNLFNSPNFANVNGIRLAYYEKGEGIPVIFCHGFPELAFTWRHQIETLSINGYRAIAPDLRGYGLTQSPKNIEDYAATKICDDLVGLLDHLNLEKAIFCGHDWGGFIVQSMAFLYPERCLGVINIGSPHAFRPEYANDLPSEDVPVVDKAAFNQFLQTPLVSEKLLNENIEKFFTTFMRSKLFHASYLRSLPVSSAERRMDLPEILKRETLPGELYLSGEELEFYVRSFKKSGFNGSINWYRAMELSWHELSKRGGTYEVEFPYLYLWPNEDPINQLGLKVGMESFIHKLESVELESCGHFPSEENPDKLSAEILVWLQKNFPRKA